jgi:hypothetical protein
VIAFFFPDDQRLRRRFRAPIGAVGFMYCWAARLLHEQQIPDHLANTQGGFRQRAVQALPDHARP